MLQRPLAAAMLVVAALAAAAAPAAAAQSQSRLVSAVPSASTPQVLDGAVKAIAGHGDLMLAGGSFTRVHEPHGATLTVRHLFAFDADTGAVVRSLTAAPDGEVHAIAVTPDGSAAFVGGTFRSVSGVERPLLARIDLATGQLDPGFDAQVDGTEVDDLQLVGARLYVAGAFGKVGGYGRSRLAAVDAQTGAVDPDVKVTFSAPRAGLLRVSRIAVSPDATHLVAMGTFTRVDGLPRPQIAMLDLSAASVTVSPWSTRRFAAPCSERYDTYMRDVDFAPDGSYFVVVTTGGYGDGPAAGVLCDSASRWETAASAPAQPTWIDYTGGDSLTAVAATGTAVYVGGHQRWFNNPFGKDRAGAGAVARAGIAALSPVNGLPYSWDPGKSRGKAVFALYADARGLWVGSDTSTFAGEYRPRLALAPLAGGHVVPAERTAVVPGRLYAATASGRVTRRRYDGTLGAVRTIAARCSRTLHASHVRGAFMLSGRVYAAVDDGTLRRARFDGCRAGRGARVDLRGLAEKGFPVARLTGLAYAGGRLLYSVAGDARLHARFFEPQSGIVGAQSFVAAGRGAVSWASVRGLAVAGDRLLYGSRSGAIRSVGLARNLPHGRSRLLARSGASRALFLLAP